MRPLAGSVLARALLLAAAVVSGCEDDLGECDLEAAEELVYGRADLVATKGQALVHDSCGNGAFCHSAGAVEDARFGAPHGMNFDMLPRPTGWPLLAERRNEIWSAVLDGDMPPARVGEESQGDGDWVFDVERREDAAQLPALSTREGKAALRNWLACNAPVVGHSKVPIWARPPTHAGDGGALDWADVYTVLRPNCAIAPCHNDFGAGGLAMRDECGAYEALREAGDCGVVRLEPGDASSLLLDKLESSEPACKMPMPPTGPLRPSDLAVVRAWVEGGAPARNCD